MTIHSEVDLCRGAYCHIDLGSLAHNCQLIKSRCSNQKICAIVKADAYGHGLAEVATAISQEVDAFGIVRLEEAALLRKIAPNKSIILMTGCNNLHELTQAQRLHCEIVFHDKSQLTMLTHLNDAQQIPVWIKIASSMHRLGFSLENCSQTINQLLQSPKVRVMGLMTHLPCADTDDTDQISQQLQPFMRIAKKHQLLVSIANSSGILRHKSFMHAHADMVRPGLCLYGVLPFTPQENDMQMLHPVMRFYASVIAINTLNEGESIGYGCSYTAGKQETILIIGAGYGDGYPRVNSGVVWVKGCLAPIRGYVSMDMMAVSLPLGCDVAIGDEVQLWGEQLRIEAVSALQQRSVYEVLMPLSNRVQRIYIPTNQV